VVVLTEGDDAQLQQWSAQLYGCFVNFLFRPVAPIRSIVAAHAERMHRGGFTLGVQLRMGGSNVRWSDPQRNDEGDIPLFFRCARDLLYAANGTEPGSCVCVCGGACACAILIVAVMMQRQGRSGRLRCPRRASGRCSS
jgi:hypothetical protein